jgi:hypothetical protein
MTIIEKLQTIYCLDELDGFLNRRQFLPSLPEWSEQDRQLILQRKYEIMRQGDKPKK